MQYPAINLETPKAIDEENMLKERARAETKPLRDYFNKEGLIGFPFDIEGFTVTIMKNNKSREQSGD